MKTLTYLLFFISFLVLIGTAFADTVIYTPHGTCTIHGDEKQGTIYTPEGTYGYSDNGNTIIIYDGKGTSSTYNKNTGTFYTPKSTYSDDKQGIIYDSEKNYHDNNDSGTIYSPSGTSSWHDSTEQDAINHLLPILFEEADKK